MNANKMSATMYRRLLGNTCVVALLFLTGAAAQAQPIFSDDFEGYADQTALNGVWVNNSAGVSASLPVGTPADGVILTNSRSFIPPSTGLKSVATRWAHDRSYVNFSTTVTAGNPSTPGQAGLMTATRNHTTVGGSSSISVVGIGWFNNATAIINGVADVFDGNYFQGKHSGTGGNLFFNLNRPGTPRRTIGWHKFDVELLTDGSQRYYVDNVLARSVTNAAFNWSVLACGFGTSSAVPAGAGEETDFDGIYVTTNNPSVTTQPTNQLVAAGSTAAFNVVASSPGAFPITGYQWYFATNLSTTVIYSTNYAPIAGATSDTLTINNINVTNQGQYLVVVKNADSSVGSAVASLTITVPSILVQPPTNQTVLQGGNFTATATAGGANPLSYQWFLNGTTAISGATTNKLTVTNIQPANVGDYTLRVTNTFGSVTSAIATLTLVTNEHPTAMSLLWAKLPGSYSWLNTDGTQRGLAYNAASNHVLVVSRTGSSLVHVLDGNDGSEIRTLDPGTGVIGESGETFSISMVGVADDGAVFVGNLTLDGVATHYRLYRYENDDAASLPTVAYDNDPGAGVTDRWGDTIAVRGAGAATQVLIASRGNGAVGNGTNLCILTTADGIAFTGNVLHVNTTNTSEFGLGLSFGKGDTLWAKSNDGTTRGLYHLAFDIASNSATTITNYTNFSAAVVNVAMNQAGNLLAGIAIETPNDVRLYDISTLANDPLLLDWEFFTPNNTGQPTGAAAFGNNRLYALNSNNGVVAAQIGWPQIDGTLIGTDLVMKWIGTYTLQSATDVIGPYSNVSGATSPYTNSVLSGQKFFRLKYP